MLKYAVLDFPCMLKYVLPRASVFLNGPREGHRSREAPRTKNEKTRREWDARPQERYPKWAVAKSVKSCEILMKSFCNSHEILEILRFNERKIMGIYTNFFLYNKYKDFTDFVGIAEGFHQDFTGFHGFRFILQLRHLDDLAHDHVTLLMRFWL
jgi:hypothetical protein